MVHIKGMKCLLLDLLFKTTSRVILKPSFHSLKVSVPRVVHIEGILV